ncbi:hypothetical protein OOZ19_01010 [Saccharopolyspora sp. NFXS83]|uniref:hypothetical protein n=1 Tax=Saccharopolyspora sp. NFXS83 TaxID=2993560 RepID=UPI00224AB393|nr:hypothetical protein [Saccharopolyspora sp. NFXS83]MCX2728808.1 hypothetical protein [Saccharopolyspora sp. NFXS83]
MTPTDSATAFLFAALLVITLGYAASCKIWPFKACRTCGGTGKLRSPFIRAIRHCPRCRATGLRPRIGLKAWNAYRRLHHSNRRNR